MRSLTYVLLLFLFWAFFSRWYYVHHIANKSGNNAPVHSTSSAVPTSGAGQ